MVIRFGQKALGGARNASLLRNMIHTTSLANAQDSAVQLPEPLPVPAQPTQALRMVVPEPEVIDLAPATPAPHAVEPRPRLRARLVSTLKAAFRPVTSRIYYRVSYLIDASQGAHAARRTEHSVREIADRIAELTVAVGALQASTSENAVRIQALDERMGQPIFALNKSLDKSEKDIQIASARLGAKFATVTMPFV
jgi:hypothetical protein